MKRIRKWLIRIGVALAILCVVLLSVGVWFVRRPWPQVSGNLQVAGISASVNVIRDRWGVPHIYAQNEHDLFFAQGYVHAQDRLWQMELIRHLSTGRVTELLGAPVVNTDRFMRTIGMRRMAEQAWDHQDEESRAILLAYADGVNAYIDTHRDRLPIEFTILGDSPSPWKPVDTLAWGVLLSIDGQLNLKYELWRASIIANLGEEKAKQFLPPYDKNMPLVIPPEASGYDWLKNAHFDGLGEVDQWLPPRSGVWGSNNWAVSGSRTQTGKPLLANDPHTQTLMALSFYENGLHGGRFNSVGFTFPGVPLVFIGHNQDIAWGITALPADVQDSYIEKLDNDQNPTKYEFKGQWYPLESTEETLQVKGGDPIKVTVLSTRHGPLMNKVLGRGVWWSGEVSMPENKPIAFRWALNDTGSNVFKAIVRINLAKQWNEFRAGLQDWDTAVQNFVYSDVQGNIGYQLAGKIPIRPPGQLGTLPVPGWTGEYEWQGYIPFDKLPSMLNPPAGFIATANNKVVSDDYPYVLASQYDPGYRAKRINSVLSAGSKFGIEDMKRLQNDTYSLPAEILRPYLLAAKPQSDLEAKALEYVKSWDLNHDVDSIGASIFETWYMYMVYDTVGDEYGTYTVNGLDYLDAVMQVDMLIRLMADPNNPWFDDTHTKQHYTRDDIVRRSLTDAVKWLSNHHGEDPSQWQWGKVNTISLLHTPLGYTPLHSLFDGQVASVPGSMFSVNANSYVFGLPFRAQFAPMLRMIADTSNWDNSLSVLVPGESNQLFLPHREDQVALWQQGAYHPMSFSREAAERNAESTLTLVP